MSRKSPITFYTDDRDRRRSIKKNYQSKYAPEDIYNNTKIICGNKIP